MRQLRRTFSIWKSVKGVWREAFPGEGDIEQKLQIRKEEAKRQRELQEKMLANGAEGVQDAVVMFGAEEPQDETLSRGERLARKHTSGPNLSEKIISQARANRDLKSLGAEMREAKFYREDATENLVNRMGNSNNTVLKTADLLRQAARERLGVAGSLEMYRRDPNFNFSAFEDELKHYFVEAYNKFTEHDVKYIEKSCAGSAYAMFMSQILVEQKAGLVRLCPGITNMHSFSIYRSAMDSENPVFVCKAKFYEINCLVHKDDPETVVEGNANKLTMKDFILIFMQHPKPDIETTGHEWMLASVVDVDKTTQIASTEETKDAKDTKDTKDAKNVKDTEESEKVSQEKGEEKEKEKIKDKQ